MDESKLEVVFAWRDGKMKRIIFNSLIGITLAGCGSQPDTTWRWLPQPKLEVEVMAQVNKIVGEADEPKTGRVYYMRSWVRKQERLGIQRRLTREEFVDDPAKQCRSHCLIAPFPRPAPGHESLQGCLGPKGHDGKWHMNKHAGWQN